MTCPIDPIPRLLMAVFVARTPLRRARAALAATRVWREGAPRCGYRSDPYRAVKDL